MSKREKMIEKIMNLRGCDRAEAEEVVDYDLKIDKMSMKELNAELTPQEKKAIKQATKAESKPRVAKTERVKKTDNEKLDLMNLIIASLDSEVSEMNIINQEREIEFRYQDRKFKIVLSAPRK